MTQAALIFTAPEETPTTFNQRLAAYFTARPWEWIDAHVLLAIGGTFAFRTRISELRRAPYYMTIENHTERLKDTHGQWYTRTRYRFEPKAS